MRNAVDFVSPPDPAVLQQLNLDGIPYTGNARPPAAWFADMKARGLTVYTMLQETISTRSQQGFQAGVYDCQFAERRAREVNPDVRFIDYVVSDGSWVDAWDCSDYGRGVNATAALGVLCYGSTGCCDTFNRGAPKSIGTHIPNTWGQGSIMTQLVAPSPVADTDLNIVHVDYTGTGTGPTKKDDDMPLYITKATDTSVGVWVTDSQTRRWVDPGEWAFAQFVGQKLVPIPDAWWNSLPDINTVGGSAPVPGPITLKGTWSTV